MRGMRKRIIPASTGGRYLPRSMAAVIKNSAFFYDILFTFTAVGQQLQDIIRIQSDAHFVCVSSQYDSADAQPSTLLQGGGTIQLQDSSGQRFLSVNQVPFSTIFGTGQRPFVWPFTHIFRANGGIVLTATNQAALVAGVHRYRFVFAGYKIPPASVTESDLEVG